MWARVLALCSVLLLKESFAEINRKNNKTYTDFFFNTNYHNRNITWMMMPDESGIVVSAVINGVTPIQEVNSKQIEFWLWNKETGKTPLILPFNGDLYSSKQNSSYQYNAHTIILIHGFTNTFVKSPFLTELAEAFLEEGKYNIIGVNWSKLASIPWYSQAVKNAGYVGCLTGKLIMALRALEQPNENLKIHIVAHNLGTLVAGEAANCIKGRKIDRITGLDPPEILTTLLPKSKKLDKADAELVEILHTSGNLIGINEAVGHRDFYANGGVWPQPGCTYDIADRCSTRKAFWLYKEAVRNKDKFKATKCPNYIAYMTEMCEGNPTLHLINNAPPTNEGRYYFNTN